MASSGVTDFRRAFGGSAWPLLVLLTGCTVVVSDCLAQTSPPPDPSGPSQPAGVGAQGAATDNTNPSGSAIPQDAFSTRIEARLEFDRLVGDQQFKDALPVGKRMVELTEQEFGKNSKETGDAYSDLANAQRQAGEHDEAEKNFLHAIDVYREVDGPFTPLAIDALTHLGDNYESAKDYLKAVSAYSEARAVNRRIYGLLNEDQIPLIDKATQSLLDLDKPADAEEQQLEALHLIERNWPEESKQGLAGIYKYAGWLGRMGRFNDERDQYTRAVRIIRQHYGKKDSRQVEPLDAIGNSFRLQGNIDPQGSASLHDALELLESQPTPDPLLLAQVLRDVGDWQVAFSQTPYDGADYRRAWAVLNNVENGERLRQEWFKGLNYVFREPVNKRLVTDDKDAPAGHVLVKFDIDTSGRADNISIVESDPPGFLDEAVLRHVRRSRFRPQIVDGEIVRGQGLAEEFTYHYQKEARDADKHGKQRSKTEALAPQVR